LKPVYNLFITFKLSTHTLVGFSQGTVNHQSFVAKTTDAILLLAQTDTGPEMYRHLGQNNNNGTTFGWKNRSGLTVLIFIITYIIVIDC